MQRVCHYVNISRSKLREGEKGKEGAGEFAMAVRVESAPSRVLGVVLFDTHQAKDKGVLLVSAFVIVFDYHQNELLATQVKLLYFGPKEQSYLCLAFKHQHPSGRQAQAVLVAIFACGEK